MSPLNDKGPIGADRQAELDALFEVEAQYWSDLYTEADVLATVHRYRTSLTLRWIDELGLPEGSAVLEVGCGPGLLAIALARRGFEVVATDPVERMLDRARGAATASGVADRIRFGRADVHGLDFPDRAFDLVVGLGVMPWIDRPVAALAEMGRVMGPGGHLILSTNNRNPLHVLADPVRLAALAPLRDRGRAIVSAFMGGSPHRPVRPISFARPDELAPKLAGVGLRLVRSQAFGFGPFTLLGRPVIPDDVGVRIERRLQFRAEREDGGLAGIAAQYLILAVRDRA
jgi:2-polyprenyl-3-methyl-5-hydroxy-6-metoxy-1,4-benzoquinol methylase